MDGLSELAPARHTKESLWVKSRSARLVKYYFKAKRMKSIKEKSEEYGLQYPVVHYDANGNPYDDVDKPSMDFEAGANYVLEQIERELQRRMLEDYNQGAEEDEVAQGCMATMIMFVRQLKK